jgi:hypothetical protein
MKDDLVETIYSKTLRAKLYKAVQYCSLIDNTRRNQPEGVPRDCLTRATEETTCWLQVVYHLAKWIDNYRCSWVIQRDWQILPKVIQSYEQKLSQENNPALRDQLQQTLAYKRQQLQTLSELQSRTERVMYHLDNTIASMGVVYSQLLFLVSSRDATRGRISRLQAEISEEVHRLEDLITAMEELHQIDLRFS